MVPTTYDPAELVADVPRRMRRGIPITVQIRAPRAGLDAWDRPIADEQGQVLMKAMVMRLRAPDGGATIELASPETQWAEGYSTPFSDDTVSWRWIVTPSRSGKLTLSLQASTRIVGRDGLAADRAVPEQTVTVRVAPNYRRWLTRWTGTVMLLAVGAAAGLILADPTAALTRFLSLIL